jgi:hypothetical protein
MTAGGDAGRAAGKTALIARLVGRKVSVSTSDFHHVVGRLVELQPDDHLRVLVRGRPVLIRRDGVARIHEADESLAEYLK